MVLQMLTRSAKDASTKHTCVRVCVCVCVCLEIDRGPTRVSKHMPVTHRSYGSHIEYNCFTICDFRLPQRGRGELCSSGLLHASSGNLPFHNHYQITPPKK